MVDKYFSGISKQHRSKKEMVKKNKKVLINLSGVERNFPLI
ncbi:hypothetical protein MmTuc01_0393 [Methanosarcina mazei Tuc01]|uniref:Uncharacterized protein n=1 Tax=Methanosarcina mazei Tuc01 TaxID=1236903 RepID=M1Q0N5_METMZ|nr:hypothetical protein MmTuc01_0393 [Methanosarcina mazei Tuc01]